MHIRVRAMDGISDVRIDSVSKLTKIEDLRKTLVTHFKVEPCQQRLFFRGKQMEDGHSLFDYNVNVNDLIQLLIRQIQPEIPKSVTCNGEDKENKTAPNLSDCPSSTKCESDGDDGPEVLQSHYYKVNDRIDAWDIDSGCWYQAKIIKITKPQLNDAEVNNNVDVQKLFNESGNMLEDADDGYIYHIYYDGFEEGDLCKMKFNAIRPCSWKKLSFDDITTGDTVLVNYFIEEPGKRGFWYDATVTKISSTSRTNKELVVTIHVLRTQVPLENCKVTIIDEIFRIEKPTEVAKRDLDLEYVMQEATIPKREIRPDCLHCKDRKSVKCKHCSCKVCGGKNDPSKQIMCDECNGAYHLWCLDPPMESLPDDEDWYCMHCKTDDTEVVRAGEKLKQSKKRAKMASTLNTSGRDWGKGMACAGRTKECTLVPPDFQGAIPGVEVGTLWKYRLQASEAGVHRPHVAGISGREAIGAFSIVLAGGYEDDKDDGDEFTYTGSGGRDLSGNKRTAQQSSDQTLTRMNRNLAMNCDAKLNAEKGAEAVNWRKGKPVRVIRSSKGKKHSKYAPEEGIRYDGLYKVVKYWPQVGQSGFKVWRYLLRRDDPIPAPWTKQGKKRIKDLGLVLQYPEGYEDENGKGKRVLQEEENNAGSPKRIKKSNYKLSDEIKKLIKEDKQNNTHWDECLQQIPEGQQKFASKVEELFLCVCCQELVCKPVTTVCCHNVCHSCLTRSFKSKMYNCPACRFVLGENYSLKVNKTLDGILCGLFPGYTAGR